MGNWGSTSWKRVVAAGILATSLTVFTGCSNGGGGGGGETPAPPLEPVKEVILPPAGQQWSVAVRANRTERFAVAYHFPPTAMRIASAAVDGPATLTHVTKQGPASVKTLASQLLPSSVSAPATGSVRALFRLGNDPETVCGSAKVYGPYSASILGSSLEFAAGSPTGASADEQTLRILNFGPFAVCMEILSTVDATLSVNGVVKDVVFENCGPPGNFGGQWTGSYSCKNSCTGQPFGGGIDLTVSQSGSVASYTDQGGATFSGTICDNVFRFERDIGVEFERGIMTFDNTSVNSATKQSTWRHSPSLLSWCGGSCIDNLVRVVP